MNHFILLRIGNIRTVVSYLVEEVRGCGPIAWYRPLSTIGYCRTTVSDPISCYNYAPIHHYQTQSDDPIGRYGESGERTGDIAYSIIMSSRNTLIL